MCFCPVSDREGRVLSHQAQAEMQPQPDHLRRARPAQGLRLLGGGSGPGADRRCRDSGQPPGGQDLHLRQQQQQVQDGFLPPAAHPSRRPDLLRRTQLDHLPGALQAQPGVQPDLCQRTLPATIAGQHHVHHPDSHGRMVTPFSQVE